MAKLGTPDSHHGTRNTAFLARLALGFLFLFFIFHFPVASLAQNIVINEIMYHPASQDVREEFVELFNAGPTNVNLTGWRISGGIDYAFPSNTVIGPGNYLVVAAHLPTFSVRYPSVANVVGSWLTWTVTNVNGRLFTNYTPVLSNTRNAVNLNNGAGTRIDEVTYADDGDWAVRRRGLDSGGFRGWMWYAEHDGLGKSLELINAAMPNEYGQNWGSSGPVGGTPGVVNSIRSSNIAPLILGAQHLPVIPRSSDANSVSARVLNEVASGVTTTLRWRVDGAPGFSSATMFDDGAHGDGAPGDGIYGAQLSALGNGTIIEYYIEASDGQGNMRTWPAPALQAPDQGNGSLGQVANALFQVDDQTSSGFPPAYRLVLTAAENNELSNMFNGSPNSDAQMNATFISVDGSGVDRRYLCGVRNRGHGSRFGTPHNCRVNFPGDTPWKGINSLNINARVTHAQVFGAALLQKAGAAGNNARFATLRVNNGTLPGGGPGNGGLYAANEDIDSDWADRQFPANSGGNIYSVVRDGSPANPHFDYRGEDPSSYGNTYFKQSNASEDDWRDLMGMLEVMGENQTGAFTLETAQKVINVEQWLTHLAIMNLCGNGESGINTGNNDDYYLYRGLNDPRFILVYHDLDQIIGFGSLSRSDPNIFRATCCPISGDSEGIWRSMAFFMHHPQVEPLYYRILQNLLNGPFSQAQFDSLIDQVFGDFSQLDDEAATMIDWMNTRRATVQGVINGFVPPATNNPTATILGEPRSPTWRTAASLSVGGTGVTHYQWRLNNGAWSAETPVATPIALSGLANSSTNTVYVVGRNSGGIYQSTATPTASRTWVVNTALPTVRLNEVMAWNASAVNHFGTFPDMIELHNEGPSSVTLTGMRLTDDPSNPGKFTFPSTTLAAGAYLTVYADSAATPGFHLGFALGQNGDGVYLFNTVASGGARLDSVQFGPQLPNFSVGRTGTTGNWVLTQPTFAPAAANVVQPLGDPRTLKINEWRAASVPPTTEDFIELYNPDALPVALGGMYLSDEPLGVPTMHRIAELSFVGSGGFTTFTADGSEGAGPEHLNFGLASEQGQIALFASDLSVVDCVVYGPQRTDISYGRCPNGGSSFGLQSFASPGSGNSCVVPPPPPPTVNLLPMTSFWRWHENTNLDGVSWQAPAFDDSGWSSGQALFGTMTNVNIGGQPGRTLMTQSMTRVTRYFRSSFVVPTNINPSALNFYYIVDDGAVVYVNGAERARYNMPQQGAILFATTASSGVSGNPPLIGPVALPLGSIQPGTNSIAVEVHQSAGSQDCFFACRLDAVLVTNSPVAAGIVINEVLADNATALTVNGRTPDVIEFYNPSTNAVDLVGMSLNDEPANVPPKWIFPLGSVVPARGYSYIYADGDLPASATNTGFGLNKNGGSLFLFKAPPLTNEVLDRLDYGLQTADYSIGRVPVGSANWMLTVPTFGGTNVVASLGDPFDLRINEYMADPESGDDWFEIHNLSGLPVALGDLRLTDVFGYADAYRIPALSYIGVGSNAFQRFEADNPSNPAGPEHVNFKLAKEGDNIYLLLSNNATILDAVNFGTQAMGVSEGRLPDGMETYVRFPDTSTPGDANYLPLDTVVVNEVLTHTDDPLEDAIELRNLTGSPVNIGGWFLSDDKDSLRKFRIPNNTTIGANGFLVFYEIAFNNDTNGAPFALSSADGDQVYLASASGSGVLDGYRSVARFGPAQNGVSFGRYVNSAGQVDYPALSARTFGQDNPANIGQFRSGGGSNNAYPKVGPIVISEIMYRPPDIIVPGVSTNDNVVEEFIELRNTSVATVPLYDPAHTTNGWRLRDAVDFTFNSTHSIPGGGHLILVSFDPATNSAARAQFQAAYGSNSVLVGPYSGKLDNSSESVELVKPDPPQTNGSVPYVLVEKVVYSDSLPWPTNADGFGESLQRVSNTGYANDPTNWIAAVPATGGGGAMDTDGDGMPDDWEMANGLNKLVPDGDGDADMDQLTNLEEYLAGTNPQSASSTLRLVATRSPSNVNLVFNAVAGRTYSIVYSSLLPAVAWTKLTDVPPQGTSAPVLVQDPTGGPQRFYKVVTPAVP